MYTVNNPTAIAPSPARALLVAARKARLMDPTARVRPVAVPDDLSALDGPPLRAIVKLPGHVHWSKPPVQYDLRIRSHRISVYEQVLCEGTHDDVRQFVRLDDLLDLWHELYLPDHVRGAWELVLGERGRVQGSS